MTTGASDNDRLWETAYGLPQIDSHILKPVLDLRLKSCDRLLDLIDNLAPLGPRQRTPVLIYRGQVTLDLYLVDDLMVGQQGLADWERANFALRVEHLRIRLALTDEVEREFDAEVAAEVEWTPPTDENGKTISPFKPHG